MRGSAFAAHAIPNGSFAGAAGANLIAVNTLVGLGAFSLLGALGIGLLGRRGRHDVATALALVMMLGLGALFLSLSTEYAPEIYSLLFGEVLGVSTSAARADAALAARLRRRDRAALPPADALLGAPGGRRGARRCAPSRMRARVPRGARARDDDDRAGRRDAPDLQPDDRRPRRGAVVHRPAPARDRAVGRDRARAWCGWRSPPPMRPTTRSASSSARVSATAYATGRLSAGIVDR